MCRFLEPPQSAEIGQFAGYLNAIGLDITNSPFSGTSIPKVKTVATSNVVEMNYASELNGTGVGMVTFFGHGNVDKTDYNAGYVTDPARGYNNPNNFPVLFYNGCSVNNIFSGRNGLFGTSPATSVRPMSLDWLLAPNKGAIIVFGNSWEAFRINSNEYLDRLYHTIFLKSDNDRGTIGQILKDVALQTKLAIGYTYNPAQNSGNAAYYNADRANVHQILLQGDPAIRVLLNEAPLSMGLAAFNARLVGENVDLEWKITSETNISQFVVERSYDGRNFEEIISEQIRVKARENANSQISYSLTDSKPMPGRNYYRLKQAGSVSSAAGSVREGEEALSRVISVEADKKHELSISPNPSTEYFDIKLDVPAKINKWRLFDLNGRVVKDNGTGNRINLTTLLPGEYIVELITDNGEKYTKKVIKL